MRYWHKIIVLHWYGYKTHVSAQGVHEFMHAHTLTWCVCTLLLHCVTQEKEKLYVELKGILARQPGPEVAEQLSIYQASLREKTKQLKALASELNMYRAQVRHTS